MDIKPTNQVPSVLGVTGALSGAESETDVPRPADAPNEVDRVIPEVLAAVTDDGEGALLPARSARKTARGALAIPAGPLAPMDAGPIIDSIDQPKAPFFDEASSVDADIRRLRLQLSERLQMQNRQLRKMLDRFDRS
jgi:hypothetical protein